MAALSYIVLITAISWPTPHHRLRSEPLLKEKPFGECTFQLSPIAVQRLHSYSTRPRGTPILIGAGWQSQTEGGIFKGTDGACADPGTQNFPCHGARTQPTLPPSSFISLTFTSQRSLLWYFLGLQESTVPPRFSYPSPKKTNPRHPAMTGECC